MSFYAPPAKDTSLHASIGPVARRSEANLRAVGERRGAIVIRLSPANQMAYFAAVFRYVSQKRLSDGTSAEDREKRERCYFFDLWVIRGVAGTKVNMNAMGPLAKRARENGVKGRIMDTSTNSPVGAATAHESSHRTR